MSRSRSPSDGDVRRSLSLDRGRSPRRSRSRSLSRSRSRSPPKERASLYVTGLAARVLDEDLYDHFKKEGKISEARVVLDPRTRDSRGFGFVDYEDIRDAERAIKYLDRSVLKGRVIMVEKAKRGRPRTPTPGAYRGHRSARDLGIRGGDRERDRDRGYRRSPSPYRRRSPVYRRRSPSPYARRRSPSPYARRRSPSPYARRRSPSPYTRRRSISP